MNRLDMVFRKTRKKALVAYVTVGYPDVATTLRLVPLLAEHGCDVIELGIPFSDPLADGATIQGASHAALLQNVTPDVCLDVAARLSWEVETPLVFMSYYNPVLRKGLDRFCAASVDSGVSGLIVPDLPPDEGTDLEEAAQRRGIDVIYLAAPSTTEERLRYVATRSRGFLYLVALIGVTGARATVDHGLEGFVARARAVSSLPLCVGFGISTPAHATRVAQVADGVIVGSQLLQLVEHDRSLESAVRFVRDLRNGIDAISG